MNNGFGAFKRDEMAAFCFPLEVNKPKCYDCLRGSAYLTLKYFDFAKQAFLEMAE